MPYRLRKNPDGSFSVVNKQTGAVHSKHTTRGKAVKQMGLLYAVDSGQPMPPRKQRRVP